MKHYLAVLMTFPIGSIVVFRGSEWLDDLKDSIGIVVGHSTEESVDPTLDILVNGRVIAILCDEFEEEELELIE